MSDLSPFLRIIADDRRLITYRPALNAVTGGVLATILLQQILHRWIQNDRQPFYKFMAPCSHEDYRPGDSWQEELGFSRREMESALRSIATKIERGVKKAQALETSLVIYWTDSNRQTWYQVNETLLAARLASLYETPTAPSVPPAPLQGNVHNEHSLGNVQNEHYLENSKTYITLPCIDDFRDDLQREELHAPLERAEPAVPALTTPENQDEENPYPDSRAHSTEQFMPPPRHATARTPRKAAARDPLLDHPAIVAYRDTCKLTPNATQRQLIAEAVGEQVADWQATLTHWMAHGWRPQNVAGMLDAYRARDKPAPVKDPRYLKAQIPFDLSNMLDPTECPRYYRRWEQETPEGRVILEQRIREGAGAR